MDLSGTVLGNYRLIRRLGAGATATVYLAEHAVMGRQAALKILHPHLLPDPASHERFQREARVLSALDHGNIVRLYDFAAGPEAVYLVCEYVEGETLSALVRRAAFPPELALPVLIEICAGIGESHCRGIVHRDIKPENILITPAGRIKVSDFGIARMLETEKLTVTGALMGSPHYMSPEQIEGGPVSPASDVFSLGVILYRLTTGQHPFEGDIQAAVLKRVLTGAYVPAASRAPRANLLVSAAIDRALLRDPGRRYPDAKAFGDALFRLRPLFGLGQADQELPDFLADPEGYSGRLHERLSAALMAQAQQARRAGNEARALAALNHTLALQGNHREALRLLSKIRGRRNWRKAGLAVSVFLLLFLATLFLPSRVHESARPSPDTLTVVRKTAPSPQPPPVQVARTRPPSETPAPRKATAVTPPAATAPETADTTAPPPKLQTGGPGRFRFSSEPWAKVYIDGEYKGKTPFAAEAFLPPGPHGILLVNPYCDTLRDSVRLSADSTVLRRYVLTRKAGGAR